MLLGFPLDY
jgi:hypothetical protein